MARPKKLDEGEVVEGEVELSDEPQVTLYGDLDEPEEIEFESEVDENLFPQYKTVTTSFRQDRIQFELPAHDRNVAALVKAGEYRVVNTHLVIARGGDGTEVYTYWTALAREY